MDIALTKFISSLSVALDYVEGELLKTTPHHGKRVAVITNRIADYMGFDKNTLYSLTQAAVMHDCALSEYLKDEFSEKGPVMEELNMKSHCVVGERMLLKLPFYKRIRSTVLYHHERADGKGAIGRPVEEVPITAQLIHISDMVDVNFSLYTMDKEKYSHIIEWIQKQAGIVFSKECAEAFLNSISYDFLSSITGSRCISMLDELLPDVSTEVSTKALKEMASVFADIIDYKSNFTWRHSLGIAEKAERMGHFYGYSEELCDKLFIAGALHDIGKLMVNNDILEKPGKLNSEEFKEIQNHAMGTYQLLHNISGLEDITRWASFHHERLDGSGYPFGLKSDDLGKNERLMACLDVYQALVEERPYKAGLSHQEAIAILRNMRDKGLLDGSIIEDINQCFTSYAKDLPLEEIAMDLHGMADNTSAGKEAWRCSICGFVYDRHLPADFMCPRCEQSAFEKILL